ncbi:MAG: aspartate aminotransferase family protein [Acidobacteriota bacterium]|nr:aspartate aminotransferase family protein [Acidobacteriota bacterium]
MRSYEKSRQLYKRACQSMAGGVSSHFRMAGQPHPLFFKRGEGARIFDADDNEYLDFTLSQGPLILGHSHPAVLRRVSEEMALGQLYAGQHELELELAERLQKLIPCADLIRFSNSGSESVQAALRLARCFTGRRKYLKFEGHYHGWFDNVLISQHPSVENAGSVAAPTKVLETGGQSPGVLDDIVVLPWNDLDAVKQVFAEMGTEIAAVITEPVMCNNGCIQPVPGYLQGLREVCDAYGTALIFDEIITGFRLGLGGAQKLYGVTPDLATFGKAIASGFPLSFLAGKRHIMKLMADGIVMHAGTYNSNNPSIAAAAATIDILESGGDQLYERLRMLGLQLREGLKDAAQYAGHEVLLSGPGEMIHMTFTNCTELVNYRDCLEGDAAKYREFAKGLLDRGVRVIGRGIWYISVAHTEQDIEHTLNVAAEVLEAMKKEDLALVSEPFLARV